MQFPMPERLIASSAYTNTSDPLVQLSTESGIQIINNKGSTIEPCGIPLRTSPHKQKKPLTFVFYHTRND